MIYRIRALVAPMDVVANGTGAPREKNADACGKRARWHKVPHN